MTSRAALDQIGVFLNDTWSFGRTTVNAGVRYDRYKGWLPEQEQLAASNGPISVLAKTFAEKAFYTWNQVAPRIGVTFDLTGDGKTVLKGNYGLFWHNPGAGVGGSGNPNTAGKSATYSWNDINGDRRWQPGEEGAQVSASLEGAIGVDPNIKAPYTHEASAWVERQLSDTMGMRAGFVYKTEDDLIATYQPFRGPSAFTIPYSYVDNGLDGRAGTSDDRTLTFFGVPTANLGSFPNTQIVQNVDQYSRYKTYEVSMNKRYGNKWSGSMGYGFTQLTDFPNGPVRNPNNPGVQDRTIWNFKATGSYDAPLGIRLSPVVRHQSGGNYARTLNISAPTALGLTATSLRTGATSDGTLAFAEPMDANREDNIWVFDIRAERSFNLTSRMRLRAYFDAFNMANSSASETISRATGLGYQKPSAILAPRTARLGFRFIF